MDFFRYHSGLLHAEEVSLETIAADVGTPCYVYSYSTIRRHYEVFAQALAHIQSLICYSVKANTSQAVLTVLASLGSGADIVSGGELARALRAGIPAGKIVFSGVGKRPDEIRAALQAGILLFNVESEPELSTLEREATDLGLRAPVSLRVNPDVDPGTHPYVATGLRKSKFGIPFERARAIYDRALRSPHLEVLGIDCHIGSQLTAVEPFVDAVQRIITLVDELQTRGAALRYVDVGGGLGIRYSEETPPSPEEYGQAVGEVVRRLDLSAVRPRDLTLVCEPGRVIVGNAGLLLTRVLYLKDNGEKRFVVVDAAMNDLIRPALYGSFHHVQRVRSTGREPVVVDVVGPVCESGDFLARDRPLEPVEAGDLIAVMSTGAYGYSMSSSYNSRPRAAEVMVRDARFAVVRPRETIEDLMRSERVPDWAARP
jgi:diaminopimelate decarboxylase